MAPTKQISPVYGIVFIFVNDLFVWAVIIMWSMFFARQYQQCVCVHLVYSLTELINEIISLGLLWLTFIPNHPGQHSHYIHHMFGSCMILFLVFLFLIEIRKAACAHIRLIVKASLYSAHAKALWWHYHLSDLSVPHKYCRPDQMSMVLNSWIQLFNAVCVI